MKRSLLFLCCILSAGLSMTPLWARISSLAEYEKNRASLTSSLQGMGLPAPEKRATSPLPIPAKPEELQAQLPESFAALTSAQQKDLRWFLGEIGKTYGPQVEQAFTMEVSRNPAKLRSVITVLTTKRSEVPALIKDIESLKALLYEPQRIAKKRPAPTFKIIPTMLNFLRSARTQMDVGMWGDLVARFIGQTLALAWHHIWKVARSAIITVVGAEKIYETNPDGSIKTDARGNRLPLMITTYEVDMQGQPRKQQTPNKWFQYIDDEQGLLGMVAQSGLDRATYSALQSIDRLFFQPLASKILNIAPWQLSYTNYLLALYESDPYNQTELLMTPQKLSSLITKTNNRQRVFVSGLPFDLRGILATKDEAVRTELLYTAVTMHIWDEYEAVDGELSGSATQPKNLGNRLLDEGKKVAADSLRGKLEEGPLAPFALYANLALKIPQALIGAHATNAQEASAKEKEYITKHGILARIDTLNQIAEQVRQQYSYNISAGTAAQQITVNEQTYTLQPQTIQRLLTAQERLLEKYIPFMPEILTGDSHSEFLKKLILPRLIVGILPERLKQELTIDTIADATKLVKVIEQKCNLLYQGLEATSELFALVETLKGKQTFAGHYTRIADALDRFLLRMSALMEAYQPGKSDNIGKRMKNLFGRNLHDLNKGGWNPVRFAHRHKNDPNWLTNLPLMRDAFDILGVGGTKAFSPQQRQEFKAALEKVGTGITKATILPLGSESLLEYLTQGTILFNGANKENPLQDTEIRTKMIEIAKDMQHHAVGPQYYKGLRDIGKGDMNPCIVSELIKTVNELHKKLILGQKPPQETDQYKTLQKSHFEEYIQWQDTLEECKTLNTNLYTCATLKAPLAEQKALKNAFDKFLALRMSDQPLDDKKEGQNKDEILEKLNKAAEKVRNEIKEVEKTAKQNLKQQEDKMKQKLQEIIDRAHALIIFTLGTVAVSKKSAVDTFFTSDEKASPAKADALLSKVNAFEKEVSLSWLQSIRGSIQFMSTIYRDYGFREIVMALDEHYLATDEKLQQIPIKMLAKIAVREGMAHAMGVGFDKLMGKMLGQLLSAASKLEDNGLFGGQILQQQIHQGLGRYIYNRGGKTNFYHMGRTLMRDLFTYGSEAASGDNIMATGMNIFMGGMGGEAQEVTRHAQLAAASGKAPLPIMAKKMKQMGINLPTRPQSYDDMNDMNDMDDIDDMDNEEQDLAVTPAIKQLINQAVMAAGAQGQDAIIAYLREHAKQLSSEDQAKLTAIIERIEAAA